MKLILPLILCVIFIIYSIALKNETFSTCESSGSLSNTHEELHNKQRYLQKILKKLAKKKIVTNDQRDAQLKYITIN
jgi:hypothetical protein